MRKLSSVLLAAALLLSLTACQSGGSADTNTGTGSRALLTQIQSEIVSSKNETAKKSSDSAGKEESKAESKPESKSESSEEEDSGKYVYDHIKIDVPEGFEVIEEGDTVKFVPKDSDNELYYMTIEKVDGELEVYQSKDEVDDKLGTSIGDYLGCDVCTTKSVGRGHELNVYIYSVGEGASYYFIGKGAVVMDGYTVVATFYSPSNANHSPMWNSLDSMRYTAN